MMSFRSSVVTHEWTWKLGMEGDDGRWVRMEGGNILFMNDTEVQSGRLRRFVWKDERCRSSAGVHQGLCSDRISAHIHHPL